jgi:hypothetical protein
VSLPLLIGGCFSLDGAYVRSRPTSDPLLEQNGTQLEPTRENFVRCFGPPTYAIPVGDGDEVCVWRDTLLPRFGEGHSDYIVTFDRSGDFKPTDISKPYGLCPRCGRDIRNATDSRCSEGDAGAATAASQEPSARP